MTVNTIVGTVILGALFVTLVLIPFNTSPEPQQRRRPPPDYPRNPNIIIPTKLGGRKKYTRRV